MWNAVKALLRSLKHFFDARQLQVETETLRQVAYDGIAFARETEVYMQKREGIALSGAEKHSLAVGFMQTALPDTPDSVCDMWIKALCAKLSGVGATGGAKL